MLKNNNKTICLTLVLSLSLLSACDRQNPLNNKAAIDDLLYIIDNSLADTWPGVCERYYINPTSLKYQQHAKLCEAQTLQVYSQYKQHPAFRGASLAQFRDAELWQSIKSQYPNRDFK